jgi:site-specific DNA recombinase
LGVIKRDLERKGVQVMFRKLPWDASPTSNLMVNILGSFAEFERELISDRTRRGRKHKIEVRKLYLGSNTSYGYRYVPKDRAAGKEGVLEVLPEEADVVRQMFAWVDEEGLSARRVLNRLNERKIPPRNGAPSWAKSSVLRILRNEMYAGIWHYNKLQGCEPVHPDSSRRYRKRAKCSRRQRPRSEWLPLHLPDSLHLVPRNRWQRVQAQLARNIAFSPRNEKHKYLLKGLIRCGGCGAGYVGDPCHGRFFYRCIRRCKKMPTVSETKLDDAVKSAVKAAMLNPRLILDSIKKLHQAEAREVQDNRKAVQVTQREAKRLEAEEQRIFDAYRAELISPAQLGQQLEKLRARRAALDLKSTSTEPPSIPREQVEKAVAEYCSEAAQNIANFDDEHWRDFLRTICHAIVFNGDQIRIQARIPFDGETRTPGPEIQLRAALVSQRDPAGASAMSQTGM